MGPEADFGTVTSNPGTSPFLIAAVSSCLRVSVADAFYPEASALAAALPVGRAEDLTALEPCPPHPATNTSDALTPTARAAAAPHPFTLPPIAGDLSLPETTDRRASHSPPAVRISRSRLRSLARAAPSDPCPTGLQFASGNSSVAEVRVPDQNAGISMGGARKPPTPMPLQKWGPVPISNPSRRQSPSPPHTTNKGRTIPDLPQATRRVSSDRSPSGRDGSYRALRRSAPSAPPMATSRVARHPR